MWHTVAEAEIGGRSGDDVLMLDNHQLRNHQTGAFAKPLKSKLPNEDETCGHLSGSPK